MKKISVLLMSLLGAAALVACGSGSSGSSGNGGGSSGVGAPESASAYSKTIPLAALPRQLGNTNLGSAVESPVLSSTTDLYISNKDSYEISFYVESNGVTIPFTMNFTIKPDSNPKPEFTSTTSAGLPANQCRFPDANGSYLCTLTISPNGAPAGKYEVIGTIVGGGDPDFVIHVINNYQQPTEVQLPYGTYANNTTYVVPDDNLPISCSGMHYKEAIPGSTVVITSTGNYSCNPLDNNCYPSPPVNTAPLPSDGHYFNAMWKNNTFSANVSFYQWDDCAGAQLASGLIATERLTYISSSQTLPYPIYVYADQSANKAAMKAIGLAR